MAYYNNHNSKHKSPLRIWLPDNGQIISYQNEPISFRGTVSLQCRQTRVRAVTVKLEGTMKVHWTQDGVSYKDEKTVYERKWDLMRSTSKYCCVQGDQEWDFVAELPGHLPASLNARDDGRHCEIVYRLKAVVERPTLLRNLTAKRTVHVSRYLRRGSTAIVRTMSHNSTYTSTSSVGIAAPAFYDGSYGEWMDYSIRLPTGTVWRPGSTVPVEFCIERVKRDVTRIRSVTCCLKSYTVLTAKGRHVRQWSRPLMHLRDDHLVRVGTPLPWRKTEHCKIPNHVSADMDTAMIHIRHKLKIIITLMRANGTTVDVKASFPIIVNHMDEPFGTPDDDPPLPSYESACDSPPYDACLLGIPSPPPESCSPPYDSYFDPPTSHTSSYHHHVTSQSCALPQYESISASDPHPR